MPVAILFIGGAANGEKRYVADETFALGRIEVRFLRSQTFIEEGPAIKFNTMTAIYVKKGRDNAAFEFEGFVEE